MPGFWETMRRLVAGEPVYRADEQDGVTHKREEAARQQAEAATGASPKEGWQRTGAPTGPKVLPIATIGRIEVQKQDYDMELTVSVRNNSLETLVIDRVSILGRTTDVNQFMKPGDEHEFRVYDGPMPVGTANDVCEVKYRNEAGDYFAAMHHVEYQSEADKRFSVRRITFNPPVRDV